MNVLLPIRSEYVEKIFSGEKKVEFRKSAFKQDVQKIFIYESSPHKCIVGYFTIKTIDIISPNRAWELYNKIGGIEKESFYKYYLNKNIAVVLIIDELVRFKFKIDPKLIWPNFRAPQSFMYIGNELENNV